MEKAVREVQVSGWKRKIGIVAVGHSVKKIEEYLVDWLIYGSVAAYCAWHWGPTYGSLMTFAIMTPVTAMLCLSYIKLYDWAKIDWLGFETVKEMCDELAHGGWFHRLMLRLLRAGDVPAFFVLSIGFDAFMTTVYLRERHRAYGGLSARDWKIFFGSLVLSNAYWTLRWTIIVEIAFYLYSNFWLGYTAIRLWYPLNELSFG